MYKIILVSVVLFFSACSTQKVAVNKQMCDKISKDPRDTIPQECIPYIEEEAAKASLNQDKQVTPKESIEFTKESE